MYNSCAFNGHDSTPNKAQTGSAAQPPFCLSNGFRMLYQIVKLVTGINLVPNLRIIEALSFASTRLHGVVL
jgi:hypothetical protein